jgi:hypothetical protein
LNSYKSLLFHGGDTGSIPVRDAKAINHLQKTALVLDQFMKSLPFGVSATDPPIYFLMAC